MASIIQITGKLGTRWRAQVRRSGMGQQTKTFSSKAAAERWGRRIEAQMDEGKVIVGDPNQVTVGKLVQMYRDIREQGERPVEPDANEHYMLEHLETDLGKWRVAALVPQQMTEWARMRKGQGAGGYTVLMELSKLGTVLRVTAARMNVVFPDVMGPARAELTYHQLIGGGNKRKRRPTEDELVRILQEMPAEYAKAAAFAAMSTLRLGELCRITWNDLRHEHQTLMVYGRKHPRMKNGVDEEVPLTDMALEILQAVARVDGEERIFPFQPNTVSRYFREACRELKISDLRFHDLRHEGTSLLFEEGGDIPHVALHTGHKDWSQLKRYTNLNPQDIKFTPEQRKARAQKKRLAVRRAVIGPQLKVVNK